MNRNFYNTIYRIGRFKVAHGGTIFLLDEVINFNVRYRYFIQPEWFTWANT